MPVPAAAIAAGASLLGQGINFYQQGKTNAQTLAYNQIMYHRQRRDALADWNMMNDYNSPKAQMARLKEAGLNPNLIYGNGTTATGQSSPVRSQDVKQFSPQAPQMDLGAVASTYYNTQTQQLQMDLLQKQAVLLDQESDAKRANIAKTYADILLKGSQRDLTDSNVQLKGVDLQYASRTKAWALAALEAQVKKTLQDTELSKANTTYRIAENERAQLRNGMTLREAAERILRMRAQTINDNARTDYQRSLAKSQIQEIEARINKINEDAKGSTEKARLLQSTPNWWTQQGVSTVENIIGNVGKKGFSMKQPGKAEPYKPAPLGGYKYGKNSKTWEPDDWEPNY